MLKIFRRTTLIVRSQTNADASMRTSPTILNVHLRTITNWALVLFVSMRMMTLGRFRLCVRRPLGFCVLSLFCGVVLGVRSSFVNHLAEEERAGYLTLIVFLLLYGYLCLVVGPEVVPRPGVDQTPSPSPVFKYPIKMK